MEPLDLTRRAPRSPQEILGGFCFLARTIDKARAVLPGGNIAAYHIAGASADLLEHVGVSVPAFVESVRCAGTDEDVITWLSMHGDLSDAATFNAAKLEATIAQVKTHQAVAFRSEHPPSACAPTDRPVRRCAGCRR